MSELRTVAWTMHHTFHISSRALTAIVLALWMGGAACTPDPAAGPSEIHWDADSCARCGMAISDRQFAAQVRAVPGAPSQKFDDIGCALLWTHALAGDQRGAARVWVTDHDSGQWLDGRSARYRAGASSPMRYGFSAHREAAAESRSFDEVTATLVEQERTGRREPGPGRP